MSSQLPDDLIAGLIRRALVPKGYRPRSEQDLNQVLEALGHVEIASDEARIIVESILHGPPLIIACQEPNASVEDESEELMAMFREEGELSAELEEELRELEEEATREADDEGEADVG